jgi:hypothetical protein
VIPTTLLVTRVFDPTSDSVFVHETPHVHATFKPMGHNYKESYSRATSSDIVISSLTQELASV